jgi:hypothetical protein
MRDEATGTARVGRTGFVPLAARCDHRHEARAGEVGAGDGLAVPGRRVRYPNGPPRSFIVLQRSNDYTDCSRDTKFKPLVLGEIHAANDIRDTFRNNCLCNLQTPQSLLQKDIVVCLRNEK